MNFFPWRVSLPDFLPAVSHGGDEHHALDAGRRPAVVRGRDGAAVDVAYPTPQRRGHGLGRREGAHHRRLINNQHTVGPLYVESIWGEKTSVYRGTRGSRRFDCGPNENFKERFSSSR